MWMRRQRREPRVVNWQAVGDAAVLGVVVVAAWVAIAWAVTKLAEALS